MKTGHLLTGAIAGVGLAAVAGALGAPLEVRLAGMALTTGCVLLPDIDSPRATIVQVLNFGLRRPKRRSLLSLIGWLLYLLLPGTLLHELFTHLSKALFRITRAERDRESAGSGHRQFTHTLVCAVLCGLGAGWATSLLPWPAAAAWWWFWGLAVGLGHAVGILGDAATVAGVPMLWPLKIDGRRWYDLRLPLTFRANSRFERYGVYPVLAVVLAGLAGQVFWGF
jgi:membrane-bound metal-dependent hydrolase YbcI (DUF457 family)